MGSNAWQRHKLGIIVDDIAMGPFGSNLKVDNFISEGVPVIRGGNLNDGGFEDDNFVFVSEEKANSLKRSLAYPDDLVFTHRGTIGQVGIIPHGKYPKYLVSQSQMRLTVSRKYLEPKFLYYFFKSPIGQYELLKNASQVGVPAIASPTTSLKEVEIDLPPLPTQRRIADILSALDEKIELNRQTNATLEAIAKSIFREWFVEFNFPGVSGEMVESELGEIPQGWMVGKLKDFGDIVCGKTPSKSNPNYFGGKIPFIKIPDMHDSVFITKTEDSLTGEGAQSQKNKFIPPYSVIVSCIATVGLVAITSEKSQTNQQINAIIPNREYLPFYLYFRTKELEGVLKDMGSGGSATLNVNTTSFSNIDCIIPPNDVLKDFHKIVKPLFERILSNEQQSATLASLRDALLPKLMSGEIEIKNN